MHTRLAVDDHGSGQVPVAALAVIKDGVLELCGRVISLDGKQSVECRLTGPVDEALVIGADLGSEMLSKGAGEILKEIR